MKIYDDEELVRQFNGKKIIVYRAAEMEGKITGRRRIQLPIKIDS